MIRRFAPWTALALVLCSFAWASAATRVWRDAAGTSQLEAELVKVEGPLVYLKAANGSVFTVPLDKLSAADRTFLAAQQPGPPATAPATTPLRPLTTSPGTLPKPTVAVAAPLAPPATILGKDQSELPVWLLVSAAQQLYQQGEYETAARFQHWVVVRQKDRGRYDLACMYSLAGNTDAAIYWLQQAALTEGTDPVFAETDQELAAVQQDARWKDVLAYLGSAQLYWKGSGLKRSTLIVPAGYRPGTPIPLVVGLHGYRHYPEGFLDEDYQQLADSLSVAFVAVSGTIPEGPNAFQWDEQDVSRNIQHVERAISELSSQVT
ncbi:MAG: hypothetical protein KDA41_16670, partial [Planctomycetales bacterium]|nr:hypothetical protein [Planctomycetales bacterium]